MLGRSTCTVVNMIFDAYIQAMQCDESVTGKALYRLNVIALVYRVGTRDYTSTLVLMIVVSKLHE